MTANVTLGVRTIGQPLLVAAALSAARIDVEQPVWWLELGSGDELQRALLYVAPRRARQAAWAVKFSRVPENREPFDGDERGLRLVHALAPLAARRVPSLLGRAQLNGLELSVETAAPGRPLNNVLSGVIDHDGEGIVAAVASWAIGLGRESRSPPESLDAERRRLATEIVPAWSDRPGLADIVQQLGPVPGVLQHNDLGTWNIVVDGDSFTVLDWESARNRGLPLWDLLYFLGDALVRLDGPGTPDEQLRGAVRLFRGDHRRSPLLFTWVRTAVRELGLHPSDVALLATLCWLHHGRSNVGRRVRLALSALDSTSASVGHLERLATPWLADPSLGMTWARWQ
jgi:hypothetical protein